jgi:succinate dehydrogenase/fumarate reductase flavoprotein subunit
MTVQPPAFPKPSVHWDLEVDLLVVGAGAAGMTAALVAAIEGCKPLICEKSPFVGGTAARSSGGIWVPGNHQTARAGKPDSLDAARTYLKAYLDRSELSPLAELYLTSGADVIDHLETNSDVKFASMEHPDYRQHEGAAMGGRPLAALPFDGRLLLEDFKLIAPPLPSLTALGGMMISRLDIPHLLRPFGSLRSFAHVVRLVGRHMLDRLSHQRGTRLLMGNALAARLFYSLKKRNVPVWTNSRVTELIRSEGRVIGAAVEAESGRQQRVYARAGVVLASGGFSYSPEWRRRLMTPAETQALSLAYEWNEGDGLTLAEASGANVERGDLANAAVWVPVSVLRTRAGTELKFPHLFMDRPKPGVVAVSHCGKRFVNEAASYHDFVAAMLKSSDAMQKLPTYLVCDRTFLLNYGLGLVLPGKRNLRKYVDAGYLTVADSIEDLATQLGMDPAVLAESVTRNNQFASVGIDGDFAKGGSAFNRFHGDSAHKPNPCLGTIVTPPFYAVAVWPADLATYAGISTDSACQALD